MNRCRALIVSAVIGTLLLTGCTSPAEYFLLSEKQTKGNAAQESGEPGIAASDEADIMTDDPYTEDSTTEPADTPENRNQGWDYYNGYSYEQDGLRKYWIEFDDEFYLHCMFRSDSPEYYEVVYTLYPDWDAATAQVLTIRTVLDAAGNDISYQFERLAFAFSSEDMVLMQVKRNESTLAGGAEDNVLTGDYVLLPRS